MTASQTQALATIQQLDPIYVDVTQSSAALLRLRRLLASGDLSKAGEDAARVTLMLEDGSVYPQEGRLEFSDVTVEQDTGAITLRAVFPNPRAQLLPGMYVRALLQEGVQEAGLLVPQQAVTRDGTGKPVAFVVGADDRLERRVLETERTVGDQWLIRGGLQAGERLVVDGQQRARAGAQVKVTSWTPKTVPPPEGVTATATATAPVSQAR